MRMDADNLCGSLDASSARPSGNLVAPRRLS